MMGTRVIDMSDCPCCGEPECTCCEGVSIPDTLHASVAVTGCIADCTGGSVDITLEKFADPCDKFWRGTYVSEIFDCGNLFLELWCGIECPFQTFCWNLTFAYETGDCQATGVSEQNEMTVYSCDPVHMAVTVNYSAVGGSGTLTIEITE